MSFIKYLMELEAGEDVVENTRMKQILAFNKENKAKLEKEIEELSDEIDRAQEEGNEGEAEELYAELERLSMQLDKLQGF